MCIRDRHSRVCSSTVVTRTDVAQHDIMIYDASGGIKSEVWPCINMLGIYVIHCFHLSDSLHLLARSHYTWGTNILHGFAWGAVCSIPQNMLGCHHTAVQLCLSHSPFVWPTFYWLKASSRVPVNASTSSVWIMQCVSGIQVPSRLVKPPIKRMLVSVTNTTHLEDKSINNISHQSFDSCAPVIPMVSVQRPLGSDKPSKLRHAHLF